MQKALFLFILLGLNSVKSFLLQLFVDGNITKSCSPPLCDGSLERPFAMMSDALRAIPEIIRNASTTETELQKIEVNLLLNSTTNYILEHQPEPFLKGCNSLDLTIQPYTNSSGRARIELQSSGSAYIIAPARLVLLSMEFTDNNREQYVEDGYFWKYPIYGVSLINTPTNSTGKHEIRLENCLFSGIESRKLNYYFSLFYMGTAETGSCYLHIENCEYTNNYFPGGMIFAVSAAKDGIKINITSSYVSDVTAIVKARSFNPFFAYSLIFQDSYLDYLTVVDLSSIISLFDNISLFLDGVTVDYEIRFIFLYRENSLFIKNLTFHKANEDALFDFIVGIFNNSVTIESSFFTYLKIIDKMKLELPIYDPYPVYHIFQNTKAFIFFHSGNRFNMTRSDFKDIYFLKQDVEQLALIFANWENELTISLCGFRQFSIETFKNDGGVLSFLLINERNNITLTQLKFENYSAFTYKQFGFIKLYEGNRLEIFDISISNTSLKTKFTVFELAAFLFRVYSLSQLKEKITALETKEFAFTTFLGLINNNTVFMDKVRAMWITCLYGCIITAASFNQIFIVNSFFSDLMSETIGVLCAVLSNHLVIANSVIKNLRSVQGAVAFLLRLNSISLSTIVFSNITTVPFIGAELELTAEGTLISAAFENKIVASEIRGNLLTTLEQGGAFCLNQNNEITVRDSNFENLDSRKLGGFLYAYAKNIILIRDVSLQKLSASEGGAFYLNSNNLANIMFLTVFGAKAFFGGVISTYLQNQLWLSSAFISDFFSSTAGSLIYSIQSNILTFNSTVYRRTESRIKSGMIHMIQANILNIYKGEWREGQSSLGGFLFLNELNNVFIEGIHYHGFQDKNTYSFFYVDRFNNLSISDCVFDFFENHLLGANLKNQITLLRVQVSDFNLYNRNGSIWVLSSNAFFVENSIFNNIESQSGAVIASSKYNFITFIACRIQNLSIISQNGAFFIQSKNHVYMKDIYCSQIMVGRASSVVFHSFYSNNIYLENFTCKGSLNSLVQDEVFLFVIEYNSNVFIKSLNIISNNKKGAYFYPSVFALVNFNLLMIKEFYVSAEYYNSLMIQYFQNYVFLDKLNIKKSRFSSTIIQLKSGYYFILLNSVFKEIVLDYGANTILKAMDTFIFFKNVNIIGWREDVTFLSAMQTFVVFTFVNMKYCIQSRTPSFENYRSKTTFARIRLHKNSQFCASYYTLRCASIFFQKFEESNIFIDSSRAFIDRSEFSFNEGLNHGGVFSTNENSALVISRCLFIANRAMHGGIFHFSNIARKHYIISNRMYFNQAMNSNYIKGKGGIFYIDSENPIGKLFNVSRNVFKRTLAPIGVICYFTNRKLNLSSEISSENSFEGNRVQLYGPFFATPPYIISLSLDGNDIAGDQTTSLLLKGRILRNWRYTIPAFFIIAFDSYGQQTAGVWESFNNDLEIDAGASYISGQFDSKESYSLKFNRKLKGIGLVEISDPGRLPSSQTLSLRFTSGEFFASVLNSTFSVVLSLRSCEIGEYLDAIQKQCINCPVSFYSFQRNFSFYTTCQRCLETLPFFCYGGNKLINKPGYWRVSEDSGEFMRCPYREACLGDAKGPSESNEVEIQEDFAMFFYAYQKIVF